MTARIGIVTVSDRASKGLYEDLGGPAIAAVLTEFLTSAWEPVARVIPDDRDGIAATLTDLIDREGCSLVLTTGGTGPAPRDVTPEATEAVCEKMMPGFGELMRQESLKQVPTAILSRQTAGIRGTGAHRQPAGQARLDPAVHDGRVPRRALLHRSHRRRAARNRPGRVQGVPARGGMTAPGPQCSRNSPSMTFSSAGPISALWQTVTR